MIMCPIDVNCRQAGPSSCKPGSAVLPFYHKQAGKTCETARAATRAAVELTGRCTTMFCSTLACALVVLSSHSAMGHCL